MKLFIKEPNKSSKNFKVILRCIVSLRLAWNTGEPAKEITLGKDLLQGPHAVDLQLLEWKPVTKLTGSSCHPNLPGQAPEPPPSPGREPWQVRPQTDWD